MMDFLNWVAEHWLLSIVLAMILSGGTVSLLSTIIVALKK